MHIYRIFQRKQRTRLYVFHANFDFEGFCTYVLIEMTTSYNLFKDHKSLVLVPFNFLKLVQTHFFVHLLLLWYSNVESLGNLQGNLVEFHDIQFLSIFLVKEFNEFRSEDLTGN